MHVRRPRARADLLRRGMQLRIHRRRPNATGESLDVKSTSESPGNCSLASTSRYVLDSISAPKANFSASRLDIAHTERSHLLVKLLISSSLPPSSVLVYGCSSIILVSLSLSLPTRFSDGIVKQNTFLRHPSLLGFFSFSFLGGKEGDEGSTTRN